MRMLMDYSGYHWIVSIHVPQLNVCVVTVGQIQALPTTVEHVARETQCDPQLSKVYRFVTKGWPAKIQEKMKPYWS